MKNENNKEKFSNEDLVELVKNGNNKAFLELEKRFAALLKSVLLRQCWQYPARKKTLENDILSNFYELIMKYDFSRGKKFAKYIVNTLHWMISNFKWKTYPIFAVKKLSNDKVRRHIELPDSISSKTNIYQESLRKQFTAEIFVWIRKNYDGWRDYRWFKRFFVERYTTYEIASQEKFSQTKIFNTIDKIRKGVKKEFGQDYEKYKEIMEETK